MPGEKPLGTRIENQQQTQTPTYDAPGPGIEPGWESSAPLLHCTQGISNLVKAYRSSTDVYTRLNGVPVITEINDRIGIPGLSENTVLGLSTNINLLRRIGPRWRQELTHCLSRGKKKLRLASKEQRTRRKNSEQAPRTSQPQWVLPHLHSIGPLRDADP